MASTEKYTPAETLQVGDVVAEADGFLLRVTAVVLQARTVLVSLTAVHGSMTWPEGEVRQQRMGRNRMVRLA